MAHIPINKRQHLRKKHYRKIAVREMLRFREMRDAFAQLSLIDESRIRHRAEREINRRMVTDGHCLFPALEKMTTKLHLAYKYTIELLETVVI